jgi:hypothetical protein
MRVDDLSIITALELLAIKKFKNTLWRQQLKKVIARRGFCWQRVMASQKKSTNRVKVADVMAENYGRKACHKKVIADMSLSLSLSLSFCLIFWLSILLSNFLFCFLGLLLQTTKSKRKKYAQTGD